jgi:hypothetical protein
MDDSTQKNVTVESSSVPSTLLTTKATIINVDKTNLPTQTLPKQDTALDNSFADPTTSPILWRLRIWDYWLTVFLCVLITLAAITASAVIFYLTRSPLSFTCLSILTLLIYLRRRSQSYLYPLTKEDLTLELARLQSKADDQQGPASSLVNLLQHFRR